MTDPANVYSKELVYCKAVLMGGFFFSVCFFAFSFAFRFLLACAFLINRLDTSMQFVLL